MNGQALDDHRIRYTHRDRLGSVISLTDHNNLLMEHRSYDPFGKPRHGSMQDPLLARLSSIAGGTPFTTRGFTDHEHLDDAELIHMNGRVYDYNLGRFLSVDPFIQAPGNSQSMNPYSYIMNNPLAGTDPSGYTSCHVDETVGDCGLKPGETAEIVDDDGKSLGSATISADGKTLKAEGNNGVNSATTSINGQAFTVNVQNVADIGSQKSIAASTSTSGNSPNIGLTDEQSNIASFEGRSRLYGEMQQMLDDADIDTVWFGVASELNQVFADNEEFLFGDSDEFLNDLGIFLYTENKTAFNDLMANKITIRGQKLDNMLVTREQGFVQSFSIERFGGPEVPFLIAAPINATFSIGRPAQPQNIRKGLEYIEKRYNTNFNFWDTYHRIELGQAMMSQARHGG